MYQQNEIDMTITITNEDKKEILKGIAEAERVIAKQLSKQESCINNSLIDSYKKYIEEMNKALKTGLLN